jgi:hypothetical protein
LCDRHEDVTEAETIMRLGKGGQFYVGNWDASSGFPSFVDEPPGDSLARTPAAVASTHRYMLNAAAWLAGRG